MSSSIEGKIDEKLEKNSKLVIENLFKAGLVPLAAATIRYPSPENISLLTTTLQLAWKIMQNDFNKTGEKQVTEEDLRKDIKEF